MASRLSFLFRSRRQVAVVAFLAAALAIPATAFAAGDLFQDISGNPFEPYINALAGAGITTGCTGGTAPNGNFCPGDTITRQAEAAFINRGMPRVAVATGAPLGASVPVGGSNYTAVASVTITVGGVTNYLSTAQQFVKVSGHFNFYDTFASRGCPCAFEALIADEANTPGESSTGIIPASSGLSDYGSGEVSAVFAESPGTHTFTLWAYLDTGASAVALDGAAGYTPTLTAATYPFGDTGGNTLTPQAPSKGSAPKALSKSTH